MVAIHSWPDFDLPQGHEENEARYYKAEAKKFGREAVLASRP